VDSGYAKPAGRHLAARAQLPPARAPLGADGSLAPASQRAPELLIAAAAAAAGLSAGQTNEPRAGQQLG